jgi:methylglutaconyl-CoA hydratase
VFEEIVGRIHEKVGGGRYSRGLRLCLRPLIAPSSELAIGIGPFVIEPAVSRKIGKTAMTEMTLAATEWKNTDWAHDKGLYASTKPSRT